MICDDCEEDKEDAEEAACPYAKEIHDSIIECNLCDDCYQERCMDI